MNIESMMNFITLSILDNQTNLTIFETAHANTDNANKSNFKFSISA